VLKNRCVHVPIFQLVVDLLRAEIEHVDLIVNLFGIHPILKPGLVQDGFDDRLRSKEELRGIGGEAPICVACLGAWSNIEIKTRIGVLKAGCRTLRLAERLPVAASHTRAVPSPRSGVRAMADLSAFIRWPFLF
jgi:hypothetical protein